MITVTWASPTRALSPSRASTATRPIRRGAIDRRPGTRAPNGILRENARRLMLAAVPEPSEAASSIPSSADRRARRPFRTIVTATFPRSHRLRARPSQGGGSFNAQSKIVRLVRRPLPGLDFAARFGRRRAALQRGECPPGSPWLHREGLDEGTVGFQESRLDRI